MEKKKPSVMMVREKARSRIYVVVVFKMNVLYYSMVTSVVELLFSTFGSLNPPFTIHAWVL